MVSKCLVRDNFIFPYEHIIAESIIARSGWSVVVSYVPSQYTYKFLFYELIIATKIEKKIT